MITVQEVKKLAALRNGENDQGVWLRLAEHFRVLGGSQDSAEAAVVIATNSLTGNLRTDVLIQSAATLVRWPQEEIRGDGYFEAADELAISIVEIGLESEDDTLALWSLDLSPRLDYLSMGLVANSKISAEVVFEIADNSGSDPIISLALLHPGLSNKQIKTLLAQVEADWLVNAVLKNDGWNTPMFQWPFKVAVDATSQSKKLWMVLLASITEFLEEGEDRFDVIEDFISYLEDNGEFTEEIQTFLKSGPELVELAQASGWSMLEEIQ